MNFQRKRIVMRRLSARPALKRRGSFWVSPKSPLVPRPFLHSIPTDKMASGTLFEPVSPASSHYTCTSRELTS